MSGPQWGMASSAQPLNKVAGTGTRQAPPPAQDQKAVKEETTGSTELEEVRVDVTETNRASSKVYLIEDPMHPKEEKHGESVMKSDKSTAVKEAMALKRRLQTQAKAITDKTKLSEKAAASYVKRSRRQWMSWGGCVWIVLIFLQFIGAVISIALLLPKKPATRDGWLDFGPRPTMLVKDVPNAVYLAISRTTAYMMYPCIILVFTSKAHCLRSWVWTTQLRLYLPFFEKLHDVHVRAGWVCLLLTWLHCVFHIIRWVRLGCMDLLFENQTGLTGLIGWICCTLVCLPMGMKILRKNIRWEVRKAIHTIGGVGFGLCGALHAPKTKVLYVYGIVVLIYLLDWLYANIFKTYEVETCHFTRLHNSVVLHWQDPPGYNHAQHGYVNICIPFIKRYEWHAISIYPHATKPGCSSLCIAKAGDWSNKLHSDTLWKTERPVWIQGPFLTPFSASVEFDNCICVSSGSGVSASLAALQSLKNHRRVSFIWLCRDHSMVEFYLKTYEFDADGYTLIFYTGKSKLSMPKQIQPNVLVFQTRPDLRSIVCMIIHSIETEDCLPESLMQESAAEEKRMQQHHDELARIHDETDPVQIFKLLLGRSLKHFSEEELLGKLAGEKESLDVSDMQRLLLHLTPEARFSDEGLEELRAFFTDGSEESTISKAKLIEHCQQVLQEYMQSAEKMEAHTSEDAKEKFAGHGGDQVLKEFIAAGTADDEEKVTGRLSRWAVLYCGGSTPVDTALSQVCRDFDITYNQEKFDW